MQGILTGFAIIGVVIAAGPDGTLTGVLDSLDQGTLEHPVGDLHRPQPLLPAQVHDLAHQRLRGAVRLRARA